MTTAVDKTPDQTQTKKEEKQMLITQFTDDFSKEVYEQTYRYGTETLQDTFERIAKDLAEAETDKEYWTEQFLKALHNFQFVPGGRITSNAGTGLTGTTLINCFVDGYEGDNIDSMEGILGALRRQALILKSEGGYGFCNDAIRPRGAFIGGIGNSSPGAVRMLDMWDTQSSVITEGSGKKNQNKKSKQKIRKGAQMVTMSCWHPDIEEFITAKQTPGRLTKFNMSVLITDDLMKAVEKNKPWNLEFPDYDKDEETKQLYKNEWDGNLKKWKEKGYPTKIYKTFANANELWNIIMKSTYTRNEPGILFIDTINRLNNLYYAEHISATNPCGEQLLPIGGVCLLGSLNLTQFIDFKNKDWDYEKLSEIIPIVVRMMDNVNDRTLVPLPSQKQNLKEKRRIGLGYLGYASSLMMLKVKYGSKKALELTKDLCEFVTNTAYQSSALLAKEKGSFTLYDEEKYLNSQFIRRLRPETIDLIRKHGIRNSHLTSIQPTGNSSVYANNVSSGLEPIFLSEYIRTTIQPFPPDNLSMPTTINWQEKQLVDYKGPQNWEWKKEGDEYMLQTVFNGITWKIDKNRGLLKETIVKDYAVRYLEEQKEWNPKADWASTTSTLSIDDHVKTMEIFAYYVDSAISKTVNLPNDYPYDDFKELYMKFYKTGTIKGGTTYRAGTMATVLSEVTKKENEDNIKQTDAPKRPKELKCDIHHVVVHGKQWIILVGMLGKNPYEVFAFKEKKLKMPTRYKTGALVKVKRGEYKLECDNGDFVLDNVVEFFETDEQEALTRMISTALRHGAKLQFVVEQLSKAEGSIVSFNKAIARTLKKYLTDPDETTCPECSEKEGIMLIEGCKKCKNCGYSACG